MMEKQRCSRNDGDGGNGSHCGKHRSESGIEAAMANVGGRQAFIDDFPTRNKLVMTIFHCKTKFSIAVWTQRLLLVCVSLFR
jgi:hypothetical protein